MSAGHLRAAAAALLVENGSLRMPIHGRSMAPALVEPMMLQIGSHADARIGAVIVFRRGAVHVAHRVVAIAPYHFRTAGDAQPHIVELVAREDIVGRVVAVWSDASPAARRIDGIAHRLRGWVCARFHPLRCAVRLSSEWLADLGARLYPASRPRTVQRLVDALSAMCRNDAAALAAQLAGDAERWRAVEARHRCAALLGEAVQRSAIADRVPAAIAEVLRRSRVEGLAHTATMEEAIGAMLAALRRAEIPFALLKGAARVYGRAADAALHRSDDIDVLVRGEDVDRAAAVLEAAGWQYAQDAATVAHFRRNHHHLASLVPPARAFPVELHHALAPPGALSLPTTWDALEPFFAPLDAAATPMLQLDPLGIALHLAIHAIGLERLRDVALLAQLLRRLSDAERQRLGALVRMERHDRVRLEAPLALAARIAGISWPTDRAVTAYIGWALRREDLPTFLRTRCDAAEAFMAGSGVRRTAWRELVPRWSRGPQIALAPLRIVGRLCTNAAALAYAAAMPERDAVAD